MRAWFTVPTAAGLVSFELQATDEKTKSGWAVLELFIERFPPPKKKTRLAPMPTCAPANWWEDPPPSDAR